MSWKIGMPNLGHTMEEGKVSEWLKRVGDSVCKGEAIAVVESDKASFDVESPADGTLIAIQAEAGAVVPVGAAIGLVGAPGETAEMQPASPAAAGRPGRLKISPAARALAEELGVDPAQIEASGEDGMLTRDDVRAHAEAHAQAHAQNRTKPLSPMRRAIAEATQRSWQSIPHVALHAHADVGALIEGGANLTAAIARAAALALVEHPAFNGWLGDKGFEPSRNVNLAVAMSAQDGLLGAVVLEAQSKTAAAIGDEIKALAASARAGRLDGARLLGASFTLSSLGRWGVDAFAPIISAPQVAALGVGRVNRIAREAAGGALRFASEIELTLVFDHRANDGVAAAQLLASIVACLENPPTMESVR